MERSIPTGLTIGLAALLVGSLVAASEQACQVQKLPPLVGSSVLELQHERTEAVRFDTSGEEAVRGGEPNLHRSAPELPTVTALLGVTPDDVRKLLASWTPGKVLPPAFDLGGVNLRTWTARGSAPR